VKAARLLVVLAVVAGVAATVATADNAPPGATARCRDGTYSFSQHRSGTCSHHGGVARWLPGAPSSSGSAGTTIGGVAVGKTVLLAKRTKTSGCVLGPNPDRRCSPGGYYSKLTEAVICAPGFRTSAIRKVSTATRHDVEAEYGLAPRSYGSTLEIDHIVSLELGGSNDIANLYPEQANAQPGYHVKDKLENKLHDMVCDGQIKLRAVQQQIAANWQALHTKVFGVAP
jgi:hypothetical protein